MKKERTRIGTTPGGRAYEAKTTKSGGFKARVAGSSSSYSGGTVYEKSRPSRGAPSKKKQVTARGYGNQHEYQNEQTTHKALPGNKPISRLQKPAKKFTELIGEHHLKEGDHVRISKKRK